MILNLTVIITFTVLNIVIVNGSQLAKMKKHIPYIEGLEAELTMSKNVILRKMCFKVSNS